MAAYPIREAGASLADWLSGGASVSGGGAPVRAWPRWSRRNGWRTLMEQQGIDDELSTSGAQELLASTSAAHLAYIAKDGTPRVIPVGFFWTGDQFVVSCATTSPKVAA